MIKEDLKTFEGQAAVPSASPTPSPMSSPPARRNLYDAVTVRPRGDEPPLNGSSQQATTAGFTSASRDGPATPASIEHRGDPQVAERRRKRLEKRRNEMRYGDPARTDNVWRDGLSEMLGRTER